MDNTDNTSINYIMHLFILRWRVLLALEHVSLYSHFHGYIYIQVNPCFISKRKRWHITAQILLTHKENIPRTKHNIFRQMTTII